MLGSREPFPPSLLDAGAAGGVICCLKVVFTGADGLGFLREVQVLSNILVSIWNSGLRQV